MYWKENIWKAENSFSSSIKTNWIGELRSFSWFAEEPTKTFTSLICFWSFSDDETLALLIRFWWLAEERPCWLVDLENSQTNKMLTFLVFLMICRRGNAKLGIDLVEPPCVTQQDGWLLFLQTLNPQRVVCYHSYYTIENTRNIWAKEGSRSFRGETIISITHCIQTQGCTTCGSLAAGLRENGERMRKWRGNGEIMRKFILSFSL